MSPLTRRDLVQRGAVIAGGPRDGPGAGRVRRIGRHEHLGGRPEGPCDLGHAYYGANLDRLRRTKAKYDPDDFFRFTQSMPPS